MQKPGLVIAMEGQRLVAIILVCKSDLKVARNSGESDGCDPRLKILLRLV